MPEVVCNASPPQYLDQIGYLELLPRLVSRIVVPTAVATELEAGRRLGLDLADPEVLPWADLSDSANKQVLRLVADLGPGETTVLALALERNDAIVIMDDALARRHAEALGLRMTGTLGVLLDAKRAGLVPALTPLAD